MSESYVNENVKIACPWLRNFTLDFDYRYSAIGRTVHLSSMYFIIFSFVISNSRLDVRRVILLLANFGDILDGQSPVNVWPETRS